MTTVTLLNKEIHAGNLILVNAKYPVQNVEGTDLTPATPEYPNILMMRKAANVFQLIFEKIGCSNEIVPVSGYRSANEQTEIYETSRQESGEDFTRKFVALPYHSEHQTGLAIDLGLKKDEIDFICPEFPYDGVCDKFRRIAPLFGFIERYPSGKEQITGIAHEPWHFRYVGYPHSQIMIEKKLTLEEYIDFIKQFPGNGKRLLTHMNDKSIEVYYVMAAKGAKTTFSLPEKAVYLVSGNNIDGFIVTLWRNRNESY